MRHPEHGPELDQKFDQPCVVRQDPDRPRLDLIEYALVEVFDGVGHVARLANLLTSLQLRQKKKLPGTGGGYLCPMQKLLALTMCSHSLVTCEGHISRNPDSQGQFSWRDPDLYGLPTFPSGW